MVSLGTEETKSDGAPRHKDLARVGSQSYGLNPHRKRSPATSPDSRDS